MKIYQQWNVCSHQFWGKIIRWFFYFFSSKFFIFFPWARNERIFVNTTLWAFQMPLPPSYFCRFQAEENCFLNDLRARFDSCFFFFFFVCRTSICYILNVHEFAKRHFSMIYIPVSISDVIRFLFENFSFFPPSCAHILLCSTAELYSEGKLRVSNIQ